MSFLTPQALRYIEENQQPLVLRSCRFVIGRLRSIRLLRISLDFLKQMETQVIPPFSRRVFTSKRV